MPRKKLTWDEMTPEQRRNSERGKKARANYLARVEREKREKEMQEAEEPLPVPAVQGMPEPPPRPVIATPPPPVEGPKTTVPLPPPPPPFHGAVQGRKERFVQADPATATGEVKIIHFVDEGGFTSLGKIWYRGDELRIEVGSDTWKQTVDPSTGKSWVELTEDEQWDKYEKVLFRPGPWRGKPPPTEAEYEAFLAKTDVEVLDDSKVAVGAAEGPEGRIPTPPPMSPKRG